MTYNSEYQKEWYERNKEAHKAKAAANTVAHRERNRRYVQEAKAVPCKDCGVQYPPYVMQFDHIGTDKLFNVSSAVNASYSLKKIQAEINKCEVVCANCHAVRTYNRSNGIIG